LDATCDAMLHFVHWQDLRSNPRGMRDATQRDDLMIDQLVSWLTAISHMLFTKVIVTGLTIVQLLGWTNVFRDDQSFRNETDVTVDSVWTSSLHGVNEVGWVTEMFKLISHMAMNGYAARRSFGRSLHFWHCDWHGVLRWRHKDGYVWWSWNYSAWEVGLWCGWWNQI
jgi:hypothetical protein